MLKEALGRIFTRHSSEEVFVSIGRNCEKITKSHNVFSGRIPKSVKDKLISSKV